MFGCLDVPMFGCLDVWMFEFSDVQGGGNMDSHFSAFFFAFFGQVPWCNVQEETF